jgi:hypothetical protein
LPEKPFTKENLDAYLKDLAKEFRKRNGNKMPAEIVLIGGAAVLAGYGFRDMTFDIDALIFASSVMKEAIGSVADLHDLPRDWLNTDFRRTASYSDKLIGVSEYYRTYSNILTVRIVTAEYLIAMKLMSGRQYKNDLSDIVGILLEHQKRGAPITRAEIEKAVAALYGAEVKIPEAADTLLDDAFSTGDLHSLYRTIRDNEVKSKEVLLEFDERYPSQLRGENINAILDAAKRKLKESPKKESLNEV